MKVTAVAAEELYHTGSRLDASFHVNDGALIARVMHGWQSKTPVASAAIDRTSQRLNGNSVRRVDKLLDVCVEGGIFVPGRFKRVYVRDEHRGERWLSPNAVLKSDLSRLPLISRKVTRSLHRLKVRKGWVLLSRSGSIGNSVYVREDLQDVVVSDDVIRVLADTKRIPSGYLYTFLSSYLGRELVRQKTYGAVIPHIEDHHLFDIPIPRIDESKEEVIHELIELSAIRWAAAASKLAEARTFFDYLLTREVRAYSPHDFSVRTVSVQMAKNRLGAHFHSQQYADLENRILSERHILLNDASRKIFAPAPFKHIYLSKPNRYPFVTGGELVNRLFTDVRYLSRLGMGNIENYVVRDRWLAIYKSGQLDSMIGTTFLISEALDGYCLSDHFIRIVADEDTIEPEYIYSFLSTWMGRLLIIRRAMGKSVPFVREDDVATLPIPLIEPAGQSSVVDLVQQAFQMQSESLDAERRAHSILYDTLGVGDEWRN